MICRRTVVGLASLLVLSLLAAPPAPAQDWAAAFESFIDEVGAYIAPVRFAQADVDSFIAHWKEVSELFEDEGEEAEIDSMDDIAASLAEATAMITGASSDPQFRAWAAKAGVDADDWMRKAMRIEMYSQQKAMGEQAAELDAEAQIAELESQRETYGDEATDAIIEGIRGMAAMRDGLLSLPAPTAAESELLDRNWARLEAMMEDEESADDDDGSDGRSWPGPDDAGGEDETQVVRHLTEMCDENWCAGDFQYVFRTLVCEGSRCTLAFSARRSGQRFQDEIVFDFDTPLLDEYGDMDPTYWERVTDALADWEEAHR